MLKEIFMELLGSFAITLFGALSRTQYKDDYFVIAFTYFLIIGGLSAASKHISGCQFNPILTVSLLITKQINLVKALLYVMFQLLGSFLGGLTIYLILNTVYSEENITYYGRAKMVENQKIVSSALEIFSMYILVFVYNSLFSSKTAPKHISAVSIASVYFVCISSFGFQSGGCISFITVFGPSFFSENYSDWALYLTGQSIGALIAALTYWVVILKKRDAFQEDDKEKLN